MDVFEFEGRTVEDAVKKAIDELKLPREKLLIKVVAEGTQGLFGMKGEKSAKIRVSIKKEEKT